MPFNEDLLLSMIPEAHVVINPFRGDPDLATSDASFAFGNHKHVTMNPADPHFMKLTYTPVAQITQGMEVPLILSGPGDSFSTLETYQAIQSNPLMFQLYRCADVPILKTPVIIINEQEISHLWVFNSLGLADSSGVAPVPSARAFELIPAPDVVRTSSYTALPQAQGSSTSSRPVEDVRVRDSTRFIRRVLHFNEVLIEKLLGSSGHGASDIARDAVPRLPPDLRSRVGFNTPNLVHLFKGQFSVTPCKEGWHISYLSATGRFTSCAGLSRGLKELRTALNAIFSPDRNKPLVFFDLAFHDWLEKLDMSHGKCLAKCNFSFVQEHLMVSLCDLVALLRSSEVEKMPQGVFEEYIKQKTAWDIDTLWDQNQYFQEPAPSTGQPPARKPSVARPVKRVKPPSSGEPQTKRAFPPSSAPPRTGTPMSPLAPCISFVAAQLGIPGNTGCSRTPCRFEHLAIPRPCPPDLRARLVGWTPSLKDAGLRTQVETAIQALP